MKRILLLFAVSLAGCGAMPTQSNFHPSVEVKGITAEQIQARYAMNCLEGGRVVQSSQYSLTCAKPFEGSGSLLYRALLTERYSSTPDVMIQTAWAPAGAGAMRVTAVAWIEHQSAFGKTTRNDLSDDSTKQSIQGALDNFKRNVESGR